MRSNIHTGIDQVGELKREIETLRQELDKRKVEEAAMRENEEKFTAAFRSNPNALVISYQEDGTMIDVNDSFLDLFQTSREEVLGKTTLEFNIYANPEDREKMLSVLRSKGNLKSLEVVVKRKSGELRTTLISAEVLTIHGRKALLGTFQDITRRKKIEDELKVQHDILEAVVRNMGTGFLVADAKGNILSNNQAAIKMHDYGPANSMITDPEEYGDHFELQRPDGEVIPPERWPLSLAIKGAFFHDYMVRFINKKTGTSRWISYNTVPIYDRSSKLMLIIVTMRDYTDINERTEALAREKELFAGIFDNIPVMITIYDPELQNFRFNKQMKKILGWTEEDASGSDLMELVYPDPAYRQDVVDFMSSLSPGWKEFRATAKDGTIIESSWANIVISSGIQIGIGIDLRELKKAEEELRKNEQRLEGIFNNVAIGIIEVDQTENIISVNDRACEILGYENNELLGKTIHEITAPEDRDLSDDLNKRLHEGEYSMFEYEKRYLKKDGSSLWVHVTVSAVKNADGEHINSIGTVEDISERRKAVEALKESEEKFRMQNEELTRFIYTVSHDLKSPLVTIKSFTSYLREDIENKDKDAQERDIHYIQNAVDKMGKLLDELLELSRIGRKEKQKTSILLENVVRSAAELVAGRLDERNINVRITGPPVMLFGHAQRFIQLYQNLFDNAAKFMGNQPEPLVEAGSFLDDNKQLVLFVRDNGMGIDPRHHHKIFGLFEKMDNTTEGTGIGLALVKRIIEVHGGSVWFSSEGHGKGTTFYFRLEGAHIIDNSNHHE
ncbi:MAG TPA: PAS domain S-box protein [Bacteroidales bacterium]|nr:PAS domain S-box protein [Bacteroidales bacterium]